MFPESNIEQRVNEHANHIVALQSTVQNLEKGQEHLQLSMTQGFARIEQMITSKSSEPPRITMALLVSLVTIGALAIGAFWTTVQLLVIPLKEQILDNRNSIGRYFIETTNYIDRAISSSDKNSMDRHQDQEEELDRHSGLLSEFYKQIVKDAERHGAMDAIEEKRAQQEELIHKEIGLLRQEIYRTKSE